MVVEATCEFGVVFKIALLHAMEKMAAISIRESIYFIRTKFIFNGRMEPRSSSVCVLKIIVLGFMMIFIKFLSLNSWIRMLD